MRETRNIGSVNLRFTRQKETYPSVALPGQLDTGVGVTSLARTGMISGLGGFGQADSMSTGVGGLCGQVQV